MKSRRFLRSTPAIRRGAASSSHAAVLAAAAATATLLIAAATYGGTVLAAGAPIPRVAPPPPKEVLVDPNDPEAGAAAAAATPLPPADPQMVASGQRMYKDLCQKCHGVNMVSPGGGFFDLRTFPRDQKPRFVDSVTNGKRAMPAWGGALKPADIEGLWAYVSSGGTGQ